MYRGWKIEQLFGPKFFARGTGPISKTWIDSTDLTRLKNLIDYAEDNHEDWP